MSTQNDLKPFHFGSLIVSAPNLFIAREVADKVNAMTGEAYLLEGFIEVDGQKFKWRRITARAKSVESKNHIAKI